jgi:hypothetical protein
MSALGIIPILDPFWYNLFTYFLTGDYAPRVLSSLIRGWKNDITDLIIQIQINGIYISVNVSKRKYLGQTDWY